eukprot:12662504-Ditylum_brightwellii.AAC.1
MFNIDNTSSGCYNVTIIFPTHCTAELHAYLELKDRIWAMSAPKSARRLSKCSISSKLPCCEKGSVKALE